MKQAHEHIGSIWSERHSKKCAAAPSAERLRWSDSKSILDHITALICGQVCESIQKANIRLLESISGDLPYRRGISVACGTGAKEMELLENNIVSHFSCYELADKAVEIGKLEAKRRNRAERITFYHADAFQETFTPESFAV